MNLARVMLLGNALFYGLAGIALLFFSEWFYDLFATFPPFNRHFMGDTGAFGLGIALLLGCAAFEPKAHAWALCSAAVIGFVHGANHVFDCLQSACTLGHFAVDSVPHLLLGSSSLWVGIVAWRKS